ncbi:hypothetical protein [Vibrio penaeicida]|uniref:DUF2326 domain-containing protein n=1 Tax=Vibrio penaeicida TaxID=104609 RepID=A0AAV5NK70_9VIBR|nr:hypothetical protein [Vibrio penaeicida]RTZ23033.1 hypothetical protein EKN09_11155 [Vibrio penaeicida]GLQ71036.1 hypothetical protein GCM10007932_03960 [Vibrio penaeicida]
MIDFHKISSHLVATLSLIEEGNLAAAKHSFNSFLSMYSEVEQLALNFVDEEQAHQISKLELNVLKQKSDELDKAIRDLEKSRDSAKRLREELDTFKSRFSSVEAIDESWNKTISAHKKEIQDSTIIINQLSQKNRELVESNRTLKEQSQLSSGVVIGALKGKGKSKLKYELKLYWESLRYDSLTFDGTRLIDNLPFHFKIYGSNGISVDVQITETGTGLLPACEELSKEYPGKPMNDLIHQQFLKLRKYVDPNILLFIQDLKNTPATTLKFVDGDVKKALQRAKKITLFDVLSTTKNTFLKDIKEAKAKVSEDDLTIFYVSTYAYATKMREKHLASDYKQEPTYQIKSK